MNQQNKKTLLGFVLLFSLVMAPLTHAQNEDLFSEEEDFSLEQGDDLVFEADEPTVEPEKEKKDEPEVEPEPEKEIVEEPPLEELPEEEPLPLETLPEEEKPLVAEPMEPEPMELEPEPEPEPKPMPAYDSPDYAYEAQLYNIYLNYHDEPTSLEEWQALVGGRETEIYEIQRGDTLWGISKTFFGDGNYWPKVWSLNGEITNPHLIQPGNVIRFMLGDEMDAPAFTITKEGQAPVEESGPEDIEIPPPSVESPPVVKNLPPSLPQWQAQNRGGDYDDIGIHFVRRPILDEKDEVPLGAYVVSNPPRGLGIVEETENSSKVAGTYEYIFVKLQKGLAQVGEKYITVENRGRLQRANDFVEGDMGYLIEVQGEIKLTEKIKGDDNDDYDYFRALVKHSFSPVMRGSHILRGQLQMVELNKNGPRNQIVAQLIGGQNDDRRQVLGPQSIAFLNRGSKDGLSEGDVMVIRSNRRVRLPETELRENIRPIGMLQVAHVEPNFASAIILEAWEPIRPGDLTGQGPMMAGIEQLKQRQQQEEKNKEPLEFSTEELNFEEEEMDFGEEEDLSFDDFTDEEIEEETLEGEMAQPSEEEILFEEDDGEFSDEGWGEEEDFEELEEAEDINFEDF